MSSRCGNCVDTYCPHRQTDGECYYEQFSQPQEVVKIEAATIPKWILDEVLDCLRQSRITHLEITALDSSREVHEKERKNDCAITRRIARCIKLLNNEI